VSEGSASGVASGGDGSGVARSGGAGSGVAASAGIELRGPTWADLRAAVPAVAAWATAGVLTGAPSARSSGITTALLAVLAVAGVAVVACVRRPRRRVDAPGSPGASAVVAASLVLSLLVAGAVGVAVAARMSVRSPDVLAEVDQERGVRGTVVVRAERDSDGAARSWPATLTQIRLGGDANADAGAGAGAARGLRVPVRVVVGRFVDDAGDTAASGPSRIVAGGAYRVVGTLRREPGGEQAAFVVFAREVPTELAPPGPVLAAVGAARFAFAVVAASHPMTG
jgi:hypothetical protein